MAAWHFYLDTATQSPACLRQRWCLETGAGGAWPSLLLPEGPTLSLQGLSPWDLLRLGRQTPQLPAELPRETSVSEEGRVLPLPSLGGQILCVHSGAASPVGGQ